MDDHVPPESAIAAIEAVMDEAATRLQSELAHALFALRPQAALLAQLTQAEPARPPGVPMTGSITILICDDDPRICLALREVVNSRPESTLCATAHDAAQAIALAHHHKPAIAIVDVSMPGGGPHAVRGILHASPHSKILAYSAYDDSQTKDTMTRAGAHRYLLKSAPVREIIAALRSLAHTDADEA